MDGGGGGVQNGVQVKPCVEDNDAEARTIRPQSCWRCRTKLEKLLSVFLVVAIITAVAMLVIVSTTENHNKTTTLHYEKGPPDNVCLTKKCVLTSSRILSAMDSTVQPCDNFFSYACGTWNKKNVIPDDRSSYNTFGKLRDELHVSLKALLEEQSLPGELEAIHNAKNLYHSCLNLRAIGKRGDGPAREILNELGGWPVLEENWDESKFDLISLMATLRMYSNRILVNQWVDSDDRNSSVNIIQLDQPHLGMPSREYYLKDRNDHQLMAYQRFCISVAKQMGADPQRAEREMTDVIDFEVKLAGITVAASFRRDTEALYNRMTVREVSTNISDKIDWLRYLNLMFNHINMTIDPSEEIVIYAPDYLHKLALLLETVPNKTVANYMLWRIMMHRVGDLGAEYLELRREYNKALHGTNKDRARWRECVSYVNDTLAWQ